jgi:deoxycytidine triphosphate deaminase
VGAQDHQYQVNGVDLTVGKIFFPVDLPFGEKPTEEDYVKMPLILEDEDVEPYWIIPKGEPVLIEIAEIVDLSLKGPFTGYAVGRSSMHRIGVIVHGAYWDFGYKGRGKLLVIPMASDLLLRKGDRFAQIAFWPANHNGTSYSGNYQGEGIKIEELNSTTDKQEIPA